MAGSDVLQGCNDYWVQIEITKLSRFKMKGDLANDEDVLKILEDIRGNGSNSGDFSNISASEKSFVIHH